MGLNRQFWTKCKRKAIKVFSQKSKIIILYTVLLIIVMLYGQIKKQVVKFIAVIQQPHQI